MAIKKEKGEFLTEEEEKLVKENRERKTTNVTIIEEPKKVDPKTKSNIKPDPKKKEIIQTHITVTPVNTLDLNKKHPNILDHSSKFIREFLSYCYKERTVVMDTKFKESKSSLIQKSIMTKELKEYIIETNIKMFEDGQKQKNIENEEYILKRNELIDALKEFLKETIIYRKEIKTEREELIKIREMIKTKQVLNRDMEKKLLDIIHDIYDINSSIQIFKDIKAFGFEDNDLIDKAFNYINNKKEEQYRNDIKKLTAKDKQNAIKIQDEIKLLSLKISEDILKKLNEIIGV